MNSQQQYIPEGGFGKVGKKGVVAVFAGNKPWRCSKCTFNRHNISTCFHIACAAEEREDRKNVYFELYNYKN